MRTIVVIQWNSNRQTTITAIIILRKCKCWMRTIFGFVLFDAVFFLTRMGFYCERRTIYWASFGTEERFQSTKCRAKVRSFGYFNSENDAIAFQINCSVCGQDESFGLMVWNKIAPSKLLDGRFILRTTWSSHFNRGHRFHLQLIN